MKKENSAIKLCSEFEKKSIPRFEKKKECILFVFVVLRVFENSGGRGIFLEVRRWLIGGFFPFHLLIYLLYL